jgi:hypothetical protein
MKKGKVDDVQVKYHGEEYRVVLGPPCFVMQTNGALMSSGMPMVNLADPKTGELRRGLTVEIPEAPVSSGQVLVCGKAEGLQALTEAGVVRFTGEYYRTKEFDATFAVCDLLIAPARQEPVRVTPGTSPSPQRMRQKPKEKSRDIYMDR